MGRSSHLEEEASHATQGDDSGNAGSESAMPRCCQEAPRSSDRPTPISILRLPPGPTLLTW